MNEQREAQSEIDFRTGVTTFVYSDVVPRAERLVCAQLNRQRSLGIQEATRPDAPGKPFSLDGWLSAIAGRAKQWGIPLVPPANFGFFRDDAESLASSELTLMGFGKEAMAWLDRRNDCVYKFFDVRNDYTLGHKLFFDASDDLECGVFQCEAILPNTLDKLCVLHEIGACPTEIVGLTDNGKYLVVKQPRCWGVEDFYLDRKAALDLVQAVTPTGSYGNEIWVFWADGQAWCMSDLHRGNIRRMSDGSPTIIDALVAPIPTEILNKYERLNRAARRAKGLRLGTPLESEDVFSGVSNDDL